MLHLPEASTCECVGCHASAVTPALCALSVCAARGIADAEADVDVDRALVETARRSQRRSFASSPPLASRHEAPPDSPSCASSDLRTWQQHHSHLCTFYYSNHHSTILRTPQNITKVLLSCNYPVLSNRVGKNAKRTGRMSPMKPRTSSRTRAHATGPRALEERSTRRGSRGQSQLHRLHKLRLALQP